MECLDVLFNIFVRFEGNDLYNYSLTCKQFNNSFSVFFNNSSSCRRFLIRRFSIPFDANDIVWTEVVKGVRCNFTFDSLCRLGNKLMLDNYIKHRDFRQYSSNKVKKYTRAITCCGNISTVDYALEKKIIQRYNLLSYIYRDVHTIERIYYHKSDEIIIKGNITREKERLLLNLLSQSTNEEFAFDVLQMLISKRICIYNFNKDSYCFSPHESIKFNRVHWQKFLDPTMEIMLEDFRNNFSLLRMFSMNADANFSNLKDEMIQELILGEQTDNKLAYKIIIECIDRKCTNLYAIIRVLHKTDFYPYFLLTGLNASNYVEYVIRSIHLLSRRRIDIAKVQALGNESLSYILERLFNVCR